MNKKKTVKPTILVTGGAGFIGSHTAVALLQNDYKVVIVDNFYNSKPFALKAIRKITGKKFVFMEGDVANKTFMRKVFKENKIDAVIHFAGYKAVGESVGKPLKYYRNNLDTTLTLLEVMQQYNCKKIVFSSSATVYAKSEVMPLTEQSPVGNATNPYGETKIMIERILSDLAIADPQWSIIALRYFNPIGAHESGLIGEEPNGIPNNLMPYIVKVATGQLDKLRVYGNDYPTPDGTGIRDYIHVEDLANAHLGALKALDSQSGIDYVNVGTGKGTSVLELVKAFEKANKIKIPYEIIGRRPGDLPEVWADPSYAKKKIHFTAKKNLVTMCKDSYRFELANSKRNK